MNFGEQIHAPAGFEGLEVGIVYHFLFSDRVLNRIVLVTFRAPIDIDADVGNRERVDKPRPELAFVRRERFEDAVLNGLILPCVTPRELPHWLDGVSISGLLAHDSADALRKVPHSQRIDQMLAHLWPAIEHLLDILRATDPAVALNRYARICVPPQNEKRFRTAFFSYISFGMERMALHYSIPNIGKWDRSLKEKRFGRPSPLGDLYGHSSCSKEFQENCHSGYSRFSGPGVSMRSIYRQTMTKVFGCITVTDSKFRMRFAHPDGKPFPTQRQGTQLIIVDELQFMTRGESSSTLIANLVAELNELGPAVVYVFNYSLGHKLLTRNQEDKDRLLAKTLILKPLHEGDPEWVSQVAAHIAVAPCLLDIEARRDAAELHRLTAGLCRLLGLLLLEACRISWHARVGRRITMLDVRAAYASSAYTSQRADIEVLRSLLVNSGFRSKRKDLVCPFPDLLITEAGINRPQQQTDSPAPAAIHVMESALNPGARRLLNELRTHADEVRSGERKPATVTKLTRRPALTAEALLAGAKLLSGAGPTKEQITSPDLGIED